MEPNTVTISPGTNQSVNTQMIILLRSCLSDNPFGLATIGWWWLLEVFGSNHSPKMAWKVTYHRVAALRLSEWRAETVFAADDDHLVGVWLIAEYVQIRETKQEYSARWRGKASSRSSLFHTQHQYTPSADMIKWYFSSDAFQFTFSDSETPKNRPYLVIHLWLPSRYPKRKYALYFWPTISDLIWRIHEDWAYKCVPKR